MLVYFNCLYITIAMVLVIDQFQFVNEITTIISGWLSNGKIKKPLNIKPFSCSLCMSWWTNLLYIIMAGKLSIFMILYILLLSFMTPVITTTLTLIKHIILFILNKIGFLFDI